MALSEQLYKLAARAKQAEDHEAASRKMAKADIEKNTQAAHDAAKAHAEDVSKKVAAGKSDISARWNNTQRSWNEHVAAARNDMHQKKANLDLKMAKHDADTAEADASVAIDYAYAAIDEAEYEVLNAVLVRKNADELEMAGAKA